MLKGDMLRKLRETKGWTQEQFAEKMGKASSTIAMYESNQRDPDTDTLSAMADLFGVSTDLLLGRVTLTDKQKSEVEALKNVFKEAGLMKNGEEDITEEEFDKIMSFVVANRKFIIPEK